MFCNKCGKEIPNGSKFCPECGNDFNKVTPAPYQQPILQQPMYAVPFPPAPKKKSKKGLIAIGIIVVFVVAVVTIFSDPATESTGDPVASFSERPSEPMIEISAVDLYEAYDANEVNADNAYKSKTLKIVGKINNIGKDIMDTTYITLGSGEEYDFTSVQCFFEDESEVAKVANLKKGQQVVIIGTCDGKFVNIMIENCSVV